MKKKIILASFCLTLALVLSACDLPSSDAAKELTSDEVKIKAQEFINDNLVSVDNQVEITQAVDEGDLYKVTVKLTDGQEVDSYMTKDGQKFFPEGMDVTEVEEQVEAQKSDATQETAQAATVATKSDQPTVELFVMSHCPYGTQIEKGLLPVLDLLGDKIDFELKFCDYAMHGEVELQEQLQQYCLQQEQNDKFLPYLTCFLESGEGDPCLTEVEADTTKLEKCVSATDEEFKVTVNFNDKSTWLGNYPTFAVYQTDNDKYSVQGSPTLVINEAEISASRDPQSLLQTVCSAFSTAPEECSQTLSSAQPSAGFGSGTSASTASADCSS